MPRPRSHAYTLPDPVRRALEVVFGERVDHVQIVEHSRYAGLHLGMRATTRPNLILLTTSGDEFVRHPDLVLHEFFHVLRQWQPRRLTRTAYVLESARRGYRENRFEVEANAFVRENVARFQALLAEQTAACSGGAERADRKPRECHPCRSAFDRSRFSWRRCSSRRRAWPT